MNKIFSCECHSLTHDSVSEVLKQIADLLLANGCSQFIRRKLFSISGECIENILNHGFYDPKIPETKSEFSIFKDDNSLYIYSYNSIKNVYLEKLRYVIDTLNTMKSADLKPYFQTTIKERSFRSFGGAGVGLIMMRRKSELPIELEIKPVNDKISTIVFKIEFELGKMKKFKKLPTKHTPLINFNLLTQTFEISGVSRPENADEFYLEVNQWIEKYSQDISKLTNPELIIDLEYFNSVSLKNLLRVFRSFISINPETIKVKWYFDKDDDSAREEAEELSEILKKDFEFIEK